MLAYQCPWNGQWLRAASGLGTLHYLAISDQPGQHHNVLILDNN